MASVNGHYMLEFKCSVTTQHWNSTFTDVTTLFSYTSTLISLVLHVHAVFATQPRTQRVATIAMSLIAVAVTISSLVWVILYQIIVWKNESGGNVPPYDQLYIADGAIQITVPGITCCVLLGKLWVAIRWRHKAGIRKFGILHILVITFGQCLVLPCPYHGHFPLS